MTEPTSKERELALTELALLQAGGLDSWEGYSYTSELYTPTGDEYEDAVSLLKALDSAGVDNWEWFSESLRGFAEYADYVEEEGETFLSFNEWSARTSSPAIEETVTAPVEESAVPKSEVDLELHRSLKTLFPHENAEALFSAVVDGGFWKRATFPKEFEVAMKQAQTQSGPFLMNAQKNLLAQVEKKGKLYEFAKQFIQA